MESLIKLLTPICILVLLLVMLLRNVIFTLLLALIHVVLWLRIQTIFRSLRLAKLTCGLVLFLLLKLLPFFAPTQSLRKLFKVQCLNLTLHNFDI